MEALRTRLPVPADTWIADDTEIEGRTPASALQRSSAAEHYRHSTNQLFEEAFGIPLLIDQLNSGNDIADIGIRLSVARCWSGAVLVVNSLHVVD